MKICRAMAAAKDNHEPNTNGAGAPSQLHNIPAIMLAGSKAIPTTVECSPSMVPFSSAGDISAMNARSTPEIIAE